uniref:Small ribosomal subunit protein eS4 n=1 Tax=Ignisphaera aggregans TaxID=334771 RepID=A0A7J2U0Y8_9CREN
MAKMGESRHLKRLAAPWFWPILRKEYKWVVKPSPGPHPINRSMPLLTVIRDVLGYAKTAKEAKYIIYSGKVLVDGVVRKDYRFPVGIMDVVAIPEIELYTRFIPYPTKYLWFTKIPKEEANLKIVRIEDKVTVKGGHIQLNLLDGRNIVIRVKDPKQPAEATNFATLDSLLIEVPSQQIIQHIKLDIGKIAIVIDGKNVGRIGKIVNMDVKPGLKRRRSVVTLEDMQGHRFQTILDYIMVVGDEKPLLTLVS